MRIPPASATLTTSSTVSPSTAATAATTTAATTTAATTTAATTQAPLPTGLDALPLQARGSTSATATTSSQAALSSALAATLASQGTPAERAENAARFAALQATWNEPVDAQLATTFAALDALRAQVAAAHAQATPAQRAAAERVALDVEQRSFSASKTLSSSWKEGPTVGRQLARATAAHVQQLASTGAPISEAAIADLNRRVRPDTKENGRGVGVGAYRAPGLSKETAFLSRCVPARHVPQAMHDFVAFLDDAAQRGLHPVERAARAYHGLVNIHGFSDGNGRTSRAVMNWILQSAGFPPIALDDPKVLSLDGDSRAVVSGMPEKAVREVVAALQRQLTDTLQALTSTTTTATTTTKTTTTAATTARFVPLKDGAAAFSNRDYRFVDVPKALQTARIEAHDGGDVGARQLHVDVDGPLFVAVAPSQHKDTASSLSSLGFTRTKHVFGYSDKQRTRVEVWRRESTAGEVVTLPSLGWAGVRRISP